MINIDKMAEISQNAYHETKQHSDAMFAFNIYPCTIPLDFAFVPLHWHYSMEMIYIKRGSGLVQVGFENFEASEGDIFVIQPGQLHGMRCLRGMKMEYENIIFEMDFIGSRRVDTCSQKYLQPLINHKVMLPVYINKEHPLYGSIGACLDIADKLNGQRPNGFELGVKGQMLAVISTLFQMATEPADASARDKNMTKIKNVLAMIEENYNEHLSVEEMSDECGYSASHFMRWFKESTGSSFTSYLIEYRLGKAANDLRSSQDTVLEIADNNGFDNLSNFNRLFKKRFGMTPSQFRNKEFI